MYSLVAGFVEAYFKKIEYKALVVGLDNSGKTTLVNAIKCSASNNPIPSNYKCFQTIGMNVEKLVNGKSTLTLWDLGGDANFRSVWERYYHESHIVVFVIDSTDRARLPEARTELEKIVQNPELSDSPILVVANKADSDDSQSVDEMLRALPLLLPPPDRGNEMDDVHDDGHEDEKESAGLMNQHHAASRSRRRTPPPRPIQLIPASAKTGLGVPQITMWLLDLVTKTDRSARLLMESSRQAV